MAPIVAAPTAAREIADALAFQDDLVVAGIDRRVGHLRGLEGESARLEWEFAQFDVGSGEDESSWLDEQAGPAIKHFDHDLLTRLPGHLEWAVGPARDQLILADDGEPFAE